jgi:ketosteroid isomerase-like protein
MSEHDIEIIKRIYGCFNSRDIDGVLAVLADDIAWANGMDGGHVLGPQAVRAYWTRQWAVVSPHVEPVAFQQTEDGAVAVEVIQTINDLNGQPLAESHGLEDKTVVHVFHMDGGKITRFDIGDWH